MNNVYEIMTPEERAVWRLKVVHKIKSNKNIVKFAYLLEPQAQVELWQVDYLYKQAYDKFMSMFWHQSVSSI